MNKQLLEKYFKGHCSDLEVEEVEMYLKQPDTQILDKLMAEKWEEQEEQPPRVFRIWYGAVAAAMLGVIAMVAFLWQTQHTAQPIALKWDTLVNRSNNVQVFMMSDGSEVWLNAHSALVYTDKYNENRELWLQGEGYFKVKEDDVHPFRVHTGKLTTTVLGTEFNLATSNKADGSIQISLMQGKVAVSMTNVFTKVLMPGQMLQYTSGQEPLIHSFETAAILDWKAGRIYLDNTTLADALTRLQQRYGYRILLEDTSLAGKKISGVFRTDIPLEKILSTLEYVHNIQFTRINDSTYQVHRKHN
jgi:ferric-dicitrate binding protein FerR (iron transport regulator)